MSTTTLRLDTSSSGIRTFHHSEFSLDQLLEAKGATTVSVCLPARNEARTVGSIVSTLRADDVMARYHRSLPPDTTEGTMATEFVEGVLTDKFSG